MPHIQQSTSATVNNNNNRFLAKVMQDSAKGSTAVSAHRRARQPSRRLCPRNIDWSGTGRSRLLVSTPSRRRRIMPRTSLKDERHRARGLFVSLNGRLEKMRDAAKMARAPTRSTNATINGVYDVTVDSLAGLNRRKLRFADGARGVALAVRWSQGTTANMVDCSGRGGAAALPSRAPSPPARPPPPPRTPPVPTLPLSVDKAFCQIRCVPFPRRRPSVERDVSTKKPNNRVQQQRRGLAGTRRGPVSHPARLRQSRCGLRPLGRSRGHGRMDEDRRVICWSINNLAVPYEKKTSIVSTGNFAVLLRARVSAMSRTSGGVSLLHRPFEPDLFGGGGRAPSPTRSAPLRCAWDSGVSDACGREDDDDAPFRLSARSVQGEAFRWAA